MGPARSGLNSQASDGDVHDPSINQFELRASRTLCISQNAKASFDPAFRPRHLLNFEQSDFVLDRRLLGPFYQKRSSSAKSVVPFTFSPSSTTGGWLLCLARLVTFMTFSLFSRARVHSPAPAPIVPSACGDCADNYHEEKQDAPPSIHFATLAFSPSSTSRRMASENRLICLVDLCGHRGKH